MPTNISYSSVDVISSLKARISKTLLKIFAYLSLKPSVRAFSIEHFAQNGKITQQRRRDFFSPRAVSFSMETMYPIHVMLAIFPNSNETRVTQQAKRMWRSKVPSCYPSSRLISGFPE